MLKNIKRKRYSDNQVVQKQKNPQLSLDCEKLGKEAELEKLRNDSNTLKMEILKIQKQQETAENYLSAVKKRLESSEYKQRCMFIFMAKAFRNSLFVEIMQQLGQKKALGNAGISKKQNLIAPQGNKSPVEAMRNTGKNQVQDEFATIESEIQTLFSSDESRSPVDQDQKASGNSGTNSLDINSENFILWEKLLEDDMVFENEVAEEQGKIQSEIVLELEELITKVTDWDVYVKEMAEQVGCLQSKS